MNINATDYCNFKLLYICHLLRKYTKTMMLFLCSKVWSFQITWAKLM